MCVALCTLVPSGQEVNPLLGTGPLAPWAPSVQGGTVELKSLSARQALSNGDVTLPLNPRLGTGRFMELAGWPYSSGKRFGRLGQPDGTCLHFHLGKALYPARSLRFILPDDVLDDDWVFLRCQTGFQGWRFCGFHRSCKRRLRRPR